MMNKNRTIKLVEIPIAGSGGFIWNRLHGQREEICEALLKDTGAGGSERKQFLQARLRKVDDALDRLMSGSYGNCSKCGRAIDETGLEMDPALALCVNCWTGKPVDTSPSKMISSGDVLPATLNVSEALH